jgi:ribosomal protein S18 acetylase RimI-like enzyme
MIEIRCFTRDDIPFALEQTTREGWFTCAGAFESYLDHDPQGNFIGWIDGERAGMITTTRYANSAWMGNLIVPPRLRSRGVGRRLMEHGLDRLQSADVRTIRLDADPPGIALYRSLGFVDECESLRFRRKSQESSPVAGVEPLAPGEIRQVQAFDARFFGDDRSRLLEMLFRRGKTALVVWHDGAVAGYVFTEETELGLRIAPCVATDAEVAGRLLQAALNSAGPQMVTLGILEANRSGRDLVESLGFRPVPSCRRMVLGEHRAEGVPGCVFAIGGGAIG